MNENNSFIARRRASSLFWRNLTCTLLQSFFSNIEGIHMQHVWITFLCCVYYFIFVFYFILYFLGYICSLENKKIIFFPHILCKRSEKKRRKKCDLDRNFIIFMAGVWCWMVCVRARVFIYIILHMYVFKKKKTTGNN
jgi:hypothetical protein